MFIFPNYLEGCFKVSSSKIICSILRIFAECNLYRNLHYFAL